MQRQTPVAAAVAVGIAADIAAAAAAAAYAAAVVPWRLYIGRGAFYC